MENGGSRIKFIYDDVGDGDVGGCHLWHSMFRVCYILIFGFFGGFEGVGFWVF